MRTDGRRDVSTAEAERSSPLQPVGPLLMCMCTSVYIFDPGPPSVVGPRRPEPGLLLVKKLSEGIVLCNSGLARRHIICSLLGSHHVLLVTLV